MNTTLNAEFNTTNSSLCEEIISQSDEKKFVDADLFFTLRRDVKEQVGWGAAALLHIIDRLSLRYGYCPASDKYLSQKMDMKEISIREYLKKLSDAGYIYRNNWNTKLGRRRHIIVEERFLKYWHGWMNRPCVPDEAKMHFIESTFGNDANLKASIFSTIQKRRESYEQSKNQRCESIGAYHATMETHRSVSKDTNTKKAKTTAARESTLESELLELGLDAAAASRLIEYWDSKPKELVGKSNAKGWLVSGVKQGWIWAKVDAAAAAQKEERVVAATQGEEERRRHGCFKLQGDCDGVGGYKLVVQEKCMQIAHRGKTWILDYKDAMFEKHFDNFKRRLYAIRDSGTTDSMDAGGQTRGKVLRQAAGTQGSTKTLSSIANGWAEGFHDTSASGDGVSHEDRQEP